MLASHAWNVNMSNNCVPFSEDDARPRILVTGGAGFVGSYLVARLLKRHADMPMTLKVVDNLWRGTLENLMDENGQPRINFEKDLCIGDLTDYAVAQKITRHVDTVYHLADIVSGIDFVFSNQAFVFDQNMQINLNTIRAARANRVPAFVYTGTACSFPKHLQSNYSVTRIPERLTYPASPESSYGWSKLMGEYQLDRERDNPYPAKFDVAIVRMHNVYGPRAGYRNGSQALPALIRKAINYPAENFKVWGSGLQYRDFMHVEDAVSAIIAARERGMNRGAVQVGTSEAITLRRAAFEVARLANELLGKQITPQFDADAFEGDKGRAADLSRASEILGWKAQWSFEDGLKDTFKWILRDMRRTSPELRQATSAAKVHNGRHDGAPAHLHNGHGDGDGHSGDNHGHKNGNGFRKQEA